MGVAHRIVIILIALCRRGAAGPGLGRQPSHPGAPNRFVTSGDDIEQPVGRGSGPLDDAGRVLELDLVLHELVVVEELNLSVGMPDDIEIEVHARNSSASPYGSGRDVYIDLEGAGHVEERHPLPMAGNELNKAVCVDDGGLVAALKSRPWPPRQPDPERILAEPCTLEVPVRTISPLGEDHGHHAVSRAHSGEGRKCCAGIQVDARTLERRAPVAAHSLVTRCDVRDGGRPILTRKG